MEKLGILEFLGIFGDFWKFWVINMHIITKEMKSLKYEGVVELKIFWSLRRLETGLSGFKLKRVHYGKLGLQIIKNHLISPQPNTPSLLSLSSKSTPLTSLLQFRVGPSPPSPFSSSHLTTSVLSLSFQDLKSFFYVLHLLFFSGPLKASSSGGWRWFPAVQRYRRREAFGEERFDFSWFPWVVLPFPTFSCHFLNSLFFSQFGRRLGVFFRRRWFLFSGEVSCCWRWVIISLVLLWFLHVPTSCLIFPFPPLVPVRPVT